MEKLTAFIMCISLALLISACGKNSETSLKPGIYTLQNAEKNVPGDFTITIYDDGTFQYYETPVSSYIGMGHYSIEKNVLTLKEDEAGCTGDINCYQISDGNLLFIDSASENYHFVPLQDGALFLWTSDVS